MARGGGTRIGGIVIDVLGNTIGLQKELKDADRAVAKFAKNFQREWKNSTSGISSAASGIVNVKNALVGIAASAGLGVLVKGTLDYADSIGEAADALGLTTKAYQELSFAASQSGIDQEKFTASFSKFVQLGESAKQGDKGPLAVFTRLGITAQEAGGDVEKLFNLVIQQLDAIPTENEKLKIIGELFGAKVAAQWKATLADGASGLQVLRDQAEAFGLVLDDKAIKGLGKLADQADAIETKFKVAFATGLVEGLTGKTGEFSDLVTDPALMTAIDGIAEGFRLVAEQVGKIPGHLHEIPAALHELEKYQDLMTLLLAVYAGGKLGSVVGGTFGGNKGRFVGGLSTAAIAGALEVMRQGLRGGTKFPDDPSFGNASFDGVTPLPVGDIPQESVNENFGPQSLIGSQPIPKAKARALGSNPLTADQEAARKAAESHQKQVDQFIDSLKAEVAGLQLETEAFGQSAEAQQEAAVQKELANTLTDKGIALGTAEAKVIEEQIRLKQAAGNEKAQKETLADLDAQIQSERDVIAVLGQDTAARVENAAVQAALNKARQEGRTLNEQDIADIRARAAELGRLTQIEQKAEEVRQGFEAAGSAIASSFEDAIFSGEKLSDVIDGLIEDLARLALRQLIEQPFINALGNFGASLVPTSGAAAAAPTVAPAELAYHTPEFNGQQASANAASNNVASKPEFNVVVVPPEGHSATTNQRQNSSGGVDFEVIVEQITAMQTAHTLRGRGFSKLFAAQGVSRGGMSG